MGTNKKIDAKKIKNVSSITPYNQGKQQYEPVIFPNGIKVDLTAEDFRRGIEIVPGTAPSNTTSKLYNENGILKFEGTVLGAVAAAAAPTSSEYVVLAVDGTLTNERVLTAGSGISITDAGAGGNVTVASTITQGANNVGWSGSAGIITTTGSLGVGVSDPDVKLEVFDTSTQLKLSYDADDYATFVVANTGDLTISTFGAGSVDSDLTLDVDGNIELNADGGTITFKDASTTLGGINTTALDINVGIDVDAGTNAIDMLTDNTSVGAITLTSQGGANQTIFIRNDGSTRADAIKLQTDDGGILLDQSGTSTKIHLDSANSTLSDAIHLESSAGSILAQANSMQISADTPVTLGTDTFLFISGSKNSIGGSTKGTAVFGGDLVVSGTQRSAGEVYITHHVYNTTGISEYYIPLNSTAEVNNVTYEWAQWLAPFDGKLLKVLYRATGATSPRVVDPGNTDIKLYINTSGSPQQTVTVYVAASVASVFNFGAVGSNTFSAGDLIGIGVDTTAAPYDAWIACIWEYNML